MQLVDKKVFFRGMLKKFSYITLVLTSYLFKGLYKAQYAQQSENIKEWLENPSNVFISNGFQPTFSLRVNEYVANDTSLLQNALWRGNIQSGFTWISSTPFGVSPTNEPVAIDIDKYLDDLTPLLISQLCSGGYEKVFIDTMNAAYRYKISTEGVGS